MIDQPFGATPPPHSNEAEQSVLGAVLIAGIGKVASVLAVDDFYRETHRLIWQACEEVDATGERVDIISVMDWFRRKKKTTLIDGGAYITMLANETPGPVNMLGWARTIKAKATLRKLIELSVDLGDRAMSGEEPEAIVADVTERLLDSTGRDAFTGPKSIRKHAAEWLDMLHEYADPDIVRADTGLADVDRIMMGMKPGELIILAGRPGAGKSAAALQVAKRVARERRVLFFSGEMSGMEIVARATGTDIPPERLRDPNQLTEDDNRQIATGIQLLKAYDLFVDDTGGLNINQISARSRVQSKQARLGLIVVDYLQLIDAKAENRTNEIALISRKLKALAKSLGVPVIGVSQLSRNLESRADKRPIMSDLRESGQIEQDADQIIFLYRHAYYHEGFESDIAEWIIAKHRHGSPGKAYTLWQGYKTRFISADRSEIERYKEMIAPDKSRSDRQRIAGGFR